MGTRSLTYVFDTYKQDNGTEKHVPLVCLYRQYDGYLEGHGLELAEFLTPFTMVNGLGADDGTKVANGMGCLAAQMVAHFKDGPGQFYIHAPELDQDCGQEYEYHVFCDRVVVYSIGSNNNNVVFEGTWTELFQKCKKLEDEYLARVAADKV
jgi:hypothetical protein